MNIKTAFKSIGLAMLLLILFTTTTFGQNAGEPTNLTAVFSIRATHLLGFESARNNSMGTLSIQERALQFQKGSEPAVHVMITSVQNVFLGDESKQVGGLPMTLGKAAIPFGGGRVVSLFAHRKYDTVALEYVASDGGIHGAIFEVSKGQGTLLRNQLVAAGAHLSHNDEIKQNDKELPNESK